MTVKAKKDRSLACDYPFSETSIEQDFGLCWKEALGTGFCTYALMGDIAYYCFASPTGTALNVAVGIGVAAMTGMLFFGKRAYGKLCP